MIFGHNPEFTNLVNLFLPDNIDNLPTSGVVTLQFDLTDWSIKKKLPSDTNVDFPKNEYF
jgi:phosphohistidine phosphatase